jgi:hypothetical protein
VTPSTSGVRERLLALGFVKRAFEHAATPLPEKPSPRLVTGLLAIALSYVVAWPAMTALGAVALYFERPVWAAVGMPALYGFSWLIWAAGMWLDGPESVAYARAFGHHVVRRFAQRFLVR